MKIGCCLALACHRMFAWLPDCRHICLTRGPSKGKNLATEKIAFWLLSLSPLIPSQTVLANPLNCFASAEMQWAKAKLV